MENEKVIEEQGLSIRDIVFIIKRNILFITLVTVIFTLAGAFYGLKIKKPSYTATSTAVVVIDTGANSNQATSFVYATYFTSTFTDFIQSNSVLNRACDSLQEEGIDINRAALANCIKVTAKTDSLIITIDADVSSKDAEEGTKNSVLIANTLLAAAIAEANRTENGVIKYEPFANKLIEMELADEEDVVSSRGAFTIAVICMLLGLALSFGLCLINYLIDDTYTSKELFEKTHGINVLSVIAEIVEYGDGGKN